MQVVFHHPYDGCISIFLHFSEVDCNFLITYMQRPQLVKGNMQLFSVEQQRSQALEAHAASFATFKVFYCTAAYLPIIVFSKNLYFFVTRY